MKKIVVLQNLFYCIYLLTDIRLARGGFLTLVVRLSSDFDGLFIIELGSEAKSSKMRCGNTPAVIDIDRMVRYLSSFLCANSNSSCNKRLSLRAHLLEFTFDFAFAIHLGFVALNATIHTKYWET